MPIHLSINGETADDVLRQLAHFAGKLSAVPAVTIERQEAPRPPVEPSAPAEQHEAEPPRPPTRTRKAKAEPPTPAGPAPFSVPGKEVEAALAQQPDPAPSAVPAPEPKAEAPAETTAVPSEDDARAALVALSKAKDMTVAGGLVKKWGVAKVSEIPAEKRAEFIAEAKALAA